VGTTLKGYSDEVNVRIEDGERFRGNVVEGDCVEIIDGFNAARHEGLDKGDGVDSAIVGNNDGLIEGFTVGLVVRSMAFNDEGSMVDFNDDIVEMIFGGSIRFNVDDADVGSMKG